MSRIQTKNGQPGIYNATPPTLTDGDVGGLAVDAGGKLITSSSSATTLTMAITDLYPQYDNMQFGGLPLRTDATGSLAVAGLFTNDLGTGRANWTGSSISYSPGTATFTNGSMDVTGSGFSTTDLHYLDFIKLSADNETFWAQVGSVTSDTTLTLCVAYTGTSATGAYDVARAATVTGSGATISVASGQATVAAGVTSGSTSVLYKTLSFPPFQNITGSQQLSISQRISNQDIYVGLEHQATSSRYFARFHFTGTNNTQVITETSYNPTTVPSASETETNTVTLPGSATTASQNTYKVDFQYDQAVFSINGIVVAIHTARLPQIWSQIMNTQIRVVNNAAVTNTNIVSNYLFVRSYTRMDVNSSPITPTIPGYPTGGAPITATSGNVAAASAVATLTSATGKTAYITGFQITASGATVGVDVNATVTGLVSGTLTYTFSFPAGALIGATPLIIPFHTPVPASATNTNIVVTLPSGGTGNTNAAVNAQGFLL